VKRPRQTAPFGIESEVESIRAAIAPAAKITGPGILAGRTDGVLDASVASKRYIPDQATVALEARLSQIMASNPRLVAPEIFFADVVSAAGAQRRGRAVLERCVEPLARFPFERVCWARVPVSRCIELIHQ